MRIARLEGWKKQSRTRATTFSVNTVIARHPFSGDALCIHLLGTKALKAAIFFQAAFISLSPTLKQCGGRVAPLRSVRKTLFSMPREMLGYKVLHSCVEEENEEKHGFRGKSYHIGLWHRHDWSVLTMTWVFFCFHLYVTFCSLGSITGVVCGVETSVLFILDRRTSVTDVVYIS